MPPLSKPSLRSLNKTALTLAISHSIAMLPTQAATILVTDFGDGDIDNQATCTLRQAAYSASADSSYGSCVAGSSSEVDSIRFDTKFPRTIELTSIAIPLQNGDIDVSASAYAPITIDASGLEEELNNAVNSQRVNLTFENITIQNSRNSGIIVDIGSTVRLVDSSIVGSGSSGVQLFDSQSRLILERSTISSNGNPSVDGGGISSQGNVTILHSTISGNTARNGGGIYLGEAAQLSSIRNSTITQNSASGDGGGFALGGVQTRYTGYRVTFSDSIISGNTATRLGDEISKSVLGGGTLIIQSRNLLGSSATSSDQAFNNFTQNSGVNANNSGVRSENIDLDNILDTRLQDNGGPTKTHNLVANSAAIGRITSTTTCNMPDQRNESRGDPSANCDLGAVEYLPIGQDIVVTESLSPSPANCDLQSAILSANTNQAHRNCSAGGVNDVISFADTLDKVSLGGALPSILSDVTIQGSGGETPTVIDALDRSRVFNISSGSRVNLDGLFITNGRAVSSNGAGILISRGSFVTLSNSVVSGNETVNSGSGAGIFASESRLNIVDSSIVSNSSASTGGGISVTDSGLEISDSFIVFNQSARQGAGVLVQTNSEFDIKGAAIVNNVSSSTGGGIRLSTSSGAVSASAIIGNSATSGAGLDLVTDAELNLVNSSVSANSASSLGGGFFVGYGASLNVLNSTIVENQNTNGIGVGGMFVRNDSTRVTLQNSILSNSGLEISNTSGTVTSLGNNLFGDISKETAFTGRFTLNGTDITATRSGTNPTAASDIFISGFGRFPLVDGSPAINAGNNDVCPATDQEGVVRNHGRCDIGAFEAPTEDICFVIKAANGKVVTFCL